MEIPVQVVRAVLASGLLVCIAGPAASAATDHPGLLYTAADVPRLLAQAQSTHKFIHDSLKAGADEFLTTHVDASGTATWTSGRTFSLGDQRDVGNALMTWSFVWQLEQTQPYLDLARNWLLDVTSWSTFDLDGQHDLLQAHLLSGAAFAYDVLYPQLSDAQRTQVRSAIAREAASLAGWSRSGLWWSSDALQNHNWVNHAAIGLAALALQGEWDAAAVDSWRALATANAARIQAACNVLTDGTWHEGFAYMSYGWNWHLPFVEALRRAGREDLTDLALLHGLGRARAHAQIPDEPSAVVLAHGDFIGFPKDDQLLALRYAASRYGDGVAQVAADRWVAGTSRFTYGPEINQQVFEFLFYDPSIAAADLSREPLDWYGKDLAAVVFRGGWDPGSLLFAMKSGAYGGRTVWQNLVAGTGVFQPANFSHDHADDNGFWIYGNGSWLAPEASGYFIGHADSPGPEANRSEFHNTLVVDGQGQLGEGVRTAGDSTSSYAWYASRGGGIPFQASTAHAAYAVAEGASLYPASMQLSQFDRHALFLDRKIVVIRDAISAGVAHDYGWKIHFMDGASREGSWVKGVGKNGQLLGMAVVSPADFGYAAETQAPQKVSMLNPSGSVTAVTISPTASTASTTFLTALVPSSTDGWASRPAVRALDAAQPGAGLEVQDGTWTSRAIFSRDPGSRQSAGSVALDGLAGAVSLSSGTPSRALLVQGRSISDGGRVLLVVSGSADALEADGLSSANLLLSGTFQGTATVWAPSATRAFLNGAEVAFQRSGESVTIAAQPASATGSSAPVAGAGPSVDPAPGAPAGSSEGLGAGSTSPVLARAAGGCSGSGAAEGVLVLSLVAAGLAVRALVSHRRRRAR